MGISSFASYEGFAVGLTLIVSGTGKINIRWRDFSKTALTIALQRWKPDLSTGAVRDLWRGIGIGEIGLGTWLVSSITPFTAGIVSATFFAGSIAYLLWAMYRVKGAPCGCVGANTPASWWSVARSAALAALAISYSINSSEDKPFGWSIAAFGVACLGFLVVLLLSPEIKGWYAHGRLALDSYGRKVRAFRINEERIQREIETLPIWARNCGGHARGRPRRVCSILARRPLVNV